MLAASQLRGEKPQVFLILQKTHGHVFQGNVRVFCGAGPACVCLRYPGISGRRRSSGCGIFSRISDGNGRISFCCTRNRFRTMAPCQRNGRAAILRPRRRGS